MAAVTRPSDCNLRKAQTKERRANMKTRPSCFGTILPDLSRLNFNRPTEGKAFGVFVEKIGCGVQRRELHVKHDEWDNCEDCPSFDSCYRMGIAKLLLWEGLPAI